jgi:mRNA interferase YafQ
MRSVKIERAYKKDFRREARGENLEAMATELPLMVATLAADIPMPSKYHDHMLSGKWVKHGECHIKPDFLLIYRKTEANELYLVRIGSHSELYGE